MVQCLNSKSQILYPTSSFQSADLETEGEFSNFNSAAGVLLQMYYSSQMIRNLFHSVIVNHVRLYFIGQKGTPIQTVYCHSPSSYHDAKEPQEQI